MSENQIGLLRKYYYDRYEKFQQQLIVIAGGTLTVFISINKGGQTPHLYKDGFVLLGISLVFGVLSSLSLQTHFMVDTELKAIETNDVRIDENARKGLNIMKKIMSLVIMAPRDPKKMKYALDMA